MSDAKTGGHGSNGEPDRPDMTHDRRTVLAKGAAAAGIGAATWIAPKIEGLTMVPDYAAAGTVSGLTITITLREDDAPGPTDAIQWTPTSGGTLASANANTRNAPVQVSIPLGAAGSAVWTFPENNAAGGDVDGPATTSDVTFNVDPPFNACRVVSGSTQFNSLGGGNTSNTTTLGPAPVPNTTGSFPQSVNHAGSGPANGTRNKSITITCS